MEEKLYEVHSGNSLIASSMPLSIALVLIEGYRDKYYNESLNLTLREMKSDNSEIDALKCRLNDAQQHLDILNDKFDIANAKLSKIMNISNTWNNKVNKMSEYDALVAIRNALLDGTLCLIDLEL